MRKPLVSVRGVNERSLDLGDLDTLLGLEAARRAERRGRPGGPRRTRVSSAPVHDARRQRAETLAAARHAEELAQETAERLAAAAAAAEERALRARDDARAAQRAAEEGAREARRKAAASVRAAREASRAAVRRKAA